MKPRAQLIAALFAVAVSALALTQCTNPANTHSESNDIQTALNAGLTPTDWQQRSRAGMTSRALEGRRVLRANGHSLGFILGVNDIAREVEVQTPGDQAISLPESGLRVQDGKIYATGTDRMAMK